MQHSSVPTVAVAVDPLASVVSLQADPALVEAGSETMLEVGTLEALW